MFVSNIEISHCIAKNCLHYSNLENLDFLKQYDYLQFYIHCRLKKYSETMVSNYTYSQ